MYRFRAMLPLFAGRNPHSKFDSVHQGQVQSLRPVSHILLKPEELPSHTKRHGDMIISLKSFLRLLRAKSSICYHAATRTGQIIPICFHVRSILVCGFLWG
jgi:hypothetical protein